MELALPLIALPAVIALTLKVGVYIYTRISEVARSAATRLFLLLLLALAIENISEIAVLYKINIKEKIPYAETDFLYIAVIVAIAFLFHLSLVLAFDTRTRLEKNLLTFVYSAAVIQVTFLIFTSWLIKDYEVLNYGFGFTVTRVPGPLYILFESYAIGSLISIVAISSYGSIKQETREKRIKNLILLLAIVPTATLGCMVVILLHLGIKWFNVSMTLPIAFTYFLIVTAYAVHNHRFLDARFSKSEFIRLQEDLVETVKQLHELKKHNPSQGDIAAMTLNDRVAQLEKRLISMALEQCGGNKAKAAAMLGLRPNTLHYKIERYGLLRVGGGELSK